MCYKTKMLNAKNRNIEFLLTEEEYNLLYSIGRSSQGRCAYTNQKFLTTRPEHPQYPTIERMDPEGPYSLENCVMVTLEANQIKNTLDTGCLPKTEHAKNIYNRLRVMTEDPNWKQIIWDAQVKPQLYKLKNKPVQTTKIKQEEQEMSQTQTSSFIANKNIDFNQDLEYAYNYAKLGKALNAVGVVFELGFNEYKYFMQKKTCQLTGKAFEENDTKSLYFKDKSLPACKANCLVTTKTIQEAVDTMLVSVKLNKSELNKLFKNLNN